MQILIQKSPDGNFIDIDTFNAFLGFEFLGAQIDFFSSIADVIAADGFPCADCVVGNIDCVKKIFALNGVKPPLVDYPLPEEYYGRLIRQIKVSEALEESLFESGPFFIKPVELKKFPTYLVRAYPHFSKMKRELEQYTDDCVWYSPFCSIQSEWRVFVYDGAVRCISYYSGSTTVFPDSSEILRMVNDLSNEMVAYALDVFVDGKGRTRCMEVNDFWSVGSYGLESALYANMLLSRYRQLKSNS